MNKKEMIKELEKLHAKLGRRPTKWDNSRLYNSSRKLFGSWNNLMKELGYKVKDIQYINTIKLNEDFYYFLGLLVTDGHIQYESKSHKYKIAIYTSYPGEVTLIKALIKDIFGYDVGVYKRETEFGIKPNYEIRINSKALAKRLINDFGIPKGNKSLIVSVPQHIMNSELSYKKAFLRGVIDGDGSILRRGIKISSGSKKFLEGIKLILNQLNISTGSVIQDNKKTKTLSIRINKSSHLTKFKEIYNTKYCYKRKKKRVFNNY